MLIDLGPDWGHIVPLEVLSKITRISYGTNTATIHYMKDDTEVALESHTVIDAKVLVNELMAIINGVIPKDRMRGILSAIEAQSGKTIPAILDRQVPDMGALRKMWAQINDKPFMQFSLSYDDEQDSVSFEVDFNDKFNSVMEKWLDKITNEVKTSDEEKALIFVANAIQEAVDPMRVGSNELLDDELPLMVQPTMMNNGDYDE